VLEIALVGRRTCIGVLAVYDNTAAHPRSEKKGDEATRIANVAPHLNK